MVGERPVSNGEGSFLSTAQAARRLGVKEETVYAYVSRGLLRSTRVPGVRGSLFPVGEVEALVSRDGTRRAVSGAVERIRTSITLQEKGSLYYRGRDATELAALPFEQVAQWLWTSELSGPMAFAAVPDVVRRAAEATRLLPDDARLIVCIRLIVDVAGACDPLRFDLTPRSVTRSSAALLGTLAAAVAEGLGISAPGEDGRLAERLWPSLRPGKTAAADPAQVELLNSALVLLADHDLAVSTLAARVAASARADLYAVLSAGLGAIDGPFHGGATSRAFRFMTEALASPADALGVRFRDGVAVPGFGHLLYAGPDPRADYLLDRLRRLDDPAAQRATAAADLVIDQLAERQDLHPNTDFALAVLGHGLGLRPDAGEAIFAIARMAGWTAHALEEYQEPELRFRVPGVYVGSRPGPVSRPD
ncbi:citrate synthase [Microlunatus panaciterrae]|uniref:citrate synthase (unknown stereospecificity) n=1 Tax=Microlunatus panaciterrae TaxID=400768 RepID=A0ABS2RGV2_9ACTN|nr:citrate synthase [Microlunatus panaciterrae]MBM7798197.1 citrate synthase [Microlunatus panaciterrae]